MATAALSTLLPSQQLASVLGLPRAVGFDDLKLADAIAEGVPARSVEALARAIDPSGLRLKAADLVPRSTLHRLTASAKPLNRDLSETLWQVARVYLEALSLYGEQDAAVAFLFRPHPLLGNRKPFDLAKASSAGADAVLTLLAQADAGVAV